VSAPAFPASDNAIALAGEVRGARDAQVGERLAEVGPRLDMLLEEMQVQRAQEARSPERAKRWRELADDYLGLSLLVEEVGAGRPSMTRSLARQQPQQQQQYKINPNGDT